MSDEKLNVSRRGFLLGTLGVAGVLAAPSVSVLDFDDAVTIEDGGYGQLDNIPYDYPILEVFDGAWRQVMVVQDYREHREMIDVVSVDLPTFDRHSAMSSAECELSGIAEFAGNRIIENAVMTVKGPVKYRVVFKDHAFAGEMFFTSCCATRALTQEVLQLELTGIFAGKVA